MGHAEIFDIPRAPYYTTGGPFLPDFPKGYAKRVGIILGTGATLITLFTMYTNMPGQRRTYTGPFMADVKEMRNNGYTPKPLAH